VNAILVMKVLRIQESPAMAVMQRRAWRPSDAEDRQAGVT
jgi:hypothetical protein